VRTDLNTLLTALHVKIDDHLGRPARTGRPPKLTDAELLTIAVAQALLGIRSETRWLRFLPRHLPGAFPYPPQQSGYNKRLRAAVPLLKHVIRMPAVDTDLWTDATWVVDSTPAGLPITRALATPKLDERQVLMAILEHDPAVLHDRPGLLIIADKGYVSRELDAFPADRGVRLLRPSYRNRTPHPAQHLLKPVRQLIESVNDTLKGQLDLELHGGRTIDGVTARIAQRLLAPDRRDLAQPRHRPTRHPIPDRLRPLIS
jgi:hypothetical protein